MNSIDLRAVFAVGFAATMSLCISRGEATAQSNLSACPSDQNQVYENCYGTTIAENGDKYIGEFRNNEKDGIGIYNFANGGKYFGEFSNDEISGRGTYILNSGDTYVGEFKDNKANGWGTFTFRSGDKYSGDIKDWKLNGRIIVSYANGDSYSGLYIADRRKGYGTYRWKDGASYSGEWTDGLPTGEGTLVNSSKQFVVGADYKSNATYDGEGFITSADSLTYSAGTVQVEDKKANLIEEVEVEGRSISVFDDFKWQFSRDACSELVQKKLFFCGDTDKWKLQTKKQNEESEAEFSVDDRNYGLYIYEKAGTVDGLNASNMRRAIIGYVTEGALKSGEAATIVEETQKIIWGNQKADTIVITGNYEGLKIVFVDTYVTRDQETLQIITYSLGDQYTQQARELHEEFVNFTAYD